MSKAIPVPGPASAQNRSIVSVSPSTSSPLHDRFRAMASGNVRSPLVLNPVENEGLKILVLENISQDAVAALRAQGYHVDHSTKAMSEDELVEKIGSYHAIGIRSKTKITERVIKAAHKASLTCFPPTC
jgi:D-3-phosphoglycerate dehydrogenase